MNEIENAIIKAIWIIRWNEQHTALKAVLTIKEAEEIVKEVINELDKAGYKIVKK